MEDGQEFIDIVETVYRGARKGQYWSYLISKARSLTAERTLRVCVVLNELRLGWREGSIKGFSFKISRGCKVQLAGRMLIRAVLMTSYYSRSWSGSISKRLLDKVQILSLAELRTQTHARTHAHSTEIATAHTPSLLKT